ncbi:DUF2316 family protein [Desulfosporosinus sp. PR]|uniref:DUF2316 family protein n=1 Tax=Candidatus Desulfosporosinus nitrosoreducens TaxID=3401928 RepID=UPI0027F22B59|nr:DUF2316 family protein [Desulfosporosinus sp. PR]MDQ7093622.1 DUF2316 family protein [Desulfosporosinus sp. PR]
MSLNAKQFEQTRIKMAANFEISGLLPETIQADLGFSAQDFKSALEVLPRYSPTNVWKLRDYLEKKILEQGKNLYPFTVLKNNIYYQY